MAPVNVTHRAIDERAQQKRGLEETNFQPGGFGKRDDDDDDCHHDDTDEESPPPAFPIVNITPASTVTIVTSSTPAAIPAVIHTLTTSSITSFTTPSTSTPSTTKPSSTSPSLTSNVPSTSPTHTPSTTIVLTTTRASTTSSSLVSVATSSLAGTTSAVTPEDQPRKQGGDGYRSSSNSSSIASTSITTATALLETSAPSGTSATLPPDAFHHHDDSLSPTAEHLLIAFGTIGVCILAAFGVWLVLRMRNVQMSSLFHRKPSESYPPPTYYPQTTENAALPAEKPSPRKFSAFYTPTSAPAPTPSEVARANTQRQELVRSALHDSNTQPMGLSPAPPLRAYSPEKSATQAFYAPVSPREEEFKPNMYRASELSSLSSGFGDAKIDVPESGPNGTALDVPRKSLAYHTSRPMFSHFSWGKESGDVGGSANGGNRDTVYTQASEAPRFRSIQSWVGQQATRVERQLNKAKGMEGMQKLTGGLQDKGHRRLDSEDPALRIHPGKEIQLEKGNRVASSILDGKVDG